MKKKKSISRATKAFIVFCVLLVTVSGVVGAVIASALNKDDAEAATPPSLYGTRDGKTVTENNDESFNYIVEENFSPIDCELPAELQEFTYYLCEAYYIDFNFAMAVMFTESSFRADIINGNDYGLMQINECNHKDLEEKLGVTNFLEPYQNIRAGLYILRGLFEKYDEPSLVCMAYNMGEYGASVLWDKGIHETSYSIKVLSKANEYEMQGNGDTNE